MAGVEVRSVSSPEETRPFQGGMGEVQVVNVKGQPVLHGTFEPGWRWSEHVKPIVGTESCQANHVLYCISGRMHIVMNDGSEAEIGPGDVVAIAPGVAIVLSVLVGWFMAATADAGISFGAGRPGTSAVVITASNSGSRASSASCCRCCSSSFSSRA